MCCAQIKYAPGRGKSSLFCPFFQCGNRIFAVVVVVAAATDMYIFFFFLFDWGPGPKVSSTLYRIVSVAVRFSFVGVFKCTDGLCVLVAR